MVTSAPSAVRTQDRTGMPSRITVSATITHRGPTGRVETVASTPETGQRAVAGRRHNAGGSDQRRGDSEALFIDAC
jgi:hypothetical protein